MAGFYGLVSKARPFRWDDEGMVVKAGGGDPEPLIAYLRGDDPLSDDDRNSLADLIEAYHDLIKHKVRANGRPRGSVKLEHWATTYAGCLVRAGREQWCYKHGRKRAPKALTQKLVKPAIELMEAEIPKARGRINAQAVEDRSYLKPDQKMIERMSIELWDARCEIVELALK